MKGQQTRSWKQRIVSLLICLIVGWLVYVEVMNVVAFHFAREWGRTHLNLALVPTPLADTKIDVLTGLLIQKFDISVQVPWKAIERDQTTNGVFVASFKDGGGILIFDRTFEVDGAKIMRGTTARQQKLMNGVFGSRTLSSNYELMAAEVKATPAEVKWWLPQATNIRTGILLVNKSMNVGKANAIHLIRSDAFRGFQYGDPDVSPYFVQLDLFDLSDNHYKIIITGKKENRQVITQAQINAIIASFHRSPDGATNLSSSSG